MVILIIDYLSNWKWSLRRDFKIWTQDLKGAPFSSQQISEAFMTYA